MFSVISWLLLNALALVNIALFAAGYLRIETFLLVLLWGSGSFLWSSSKQTWFQRHKDLLNAISIVLASTLALLLPGLQAVVPLISYNIQDKKTYYALLVCALLPLWLPAGFLAYILFALILLLSVTLANGERASSDFRHAQLARWDRLTGDYERLSRDRERLLLEQELIRENATLEERNRIAAEIHDHVGHRITSAVLQLKVLELSLPAERQDQVAAIKDQLQAAMEDLRTSVHQLHETSLDLEHALSELADQYGFCPVHIDLDLQSQPPPAIHHAVLAIAQEALANTAKHSDASRVDISFKQGNKFYQLLIYDNGSSTSMKTGGIGLFNMEDRVHRLGGEIIFSQNHGFRIFAKIPLEDAGLDPSPLQGSNK